MAACIVRPPVDSRFPRVRDRRHSGAAATSSTPPISRMANAPGGEIATARAPCATANVTPTDM